MGDIYTKAVLSVIAGALLALAAQGALKQASAQPVGCGSDVNNPCFVTIFSSTDRPVVVGVMNLPVPVRIVP